MSTSPPADEPIDQEPPPEDDVTDIDPEDDEELVDGMSRQSFPTSDPPSTWGGVDQPDA